MTKFTLTIEADNLTEFYAKINDAANKTKTIPVVSNTVTYIEEPVSVVKNIVEEGPKAEKPVIDEASMDNYPSEPVEADKPKRRRRTKAEIEEDLKKSEPTPVVEAPVTPMPKLPTTEHRVEMPTPPTFTVPTLVEAPAPILDVKSFEYFKVNFIEIMSNLFMTGKLGEEWVIKHKPMFNNKEVANWPEEAKALEGLHGFLLQNGLI